MPWRKSFPLLRRFEKQRKGDAALTTTDDSVAPPRQRDSELRAGTQERRASTAASSTSSPPRSQLKLYRRKSEISFRCSGEVDLVVAAAQEDYDRAYAGGLFDLNEPPPRPGLGLGHTSEPSSLLPANQRLVPGYVPIPSPDQPTQQVALDQLDILGDDLMNVPVPSRPLSPVLSSSSSSPSREAIATISPPEHIRATLRGRATPKLPLHRAPSEACDPRAKTLDESPSSSSYAASHTTTETSPTRSFSSATQESSRLSPSQAMNPSHHTISNPTATLTDHPICRAIVKNCREAFNAPTAFLAVADQDRLVYLASSRIGRSKEDKIEAILPFHATICAHTVLNHERGLVVPDTKLDWRFKDSLPASLLGVRFYAAFPITAPSQLSDPDSRRVPIGSLCIVSPEPSHPFTPQDGNKLRQLAEHASREIEAWARARLAIKMLSLSRFIEAWRTKLRYFSPSISLELLFELTVRTIASALSLDLVYALTLDPILDWCALPSLQRLLARHPSSLETGIYVDPQLHIEALKQGNRGVMYEASDERLDEQVPRRGLVISVMVRGEGDGIVLGAFTNDPKRLICAENFKFLRGVVDDLRDRLEFDVGVEEK